MLTQTSDSITSQIRECNDAFEASFMEQNSARIAGLYTEDAALLPPGASTQTGREAIQNFWQGAMQMGISKATLTTDEAEDHGDTAIEIGNFALYSANGDTIDHGKYMVIWKKQNGQWLLHKDIWNSSQSAG